MPGIKNKHQVPLQSKRRPMGLIHPLVCLFFLFAHASTCEAKNTLSWNGSISSDWNTAGNWKPQFVPGTADDVQIGMTAFINQPIINNVLQCATITFGSRQAILLTINAGAGITVSGAITQGHSEDNVVPNTMITGNGNLTCGLLVVGDGLPSKVVNVKTTTLVSTLASFTVNGNVFVNSVASFLLSGGIAHNNSLFSLQGGQLNVGGQIKLTNLLPAYLSGELTSLTPSARFVIDVTSGLNPKLKVLGNIAVNIADTNWDTIDYYNYASLPATGSSTVEYGGGGQIVSTSATAGLDLMPKPYQNLIISGTGVKKTESASGDSLKIGGYLKVLPDTLDMQINGAFLGVQGNFSNSGTVKLSKTIFLGANFSNTGTITTGVDTIKFLGANQALRDTTANSTSFNNALFTSGTKTISSGEFALPAGGYWKVGNDSTTVAISGGAELVFHSDNTGLSTMVFTSVAPPPPGSPPVAFFSTYKKTNGVAAKPAAPVIRRGNITLVNKHTAAKPKIAKNLTLRKPAAPKNVATIPGKQIPVIPDKQISFRLAGNNANSGDLVVQFKNNASTKYMPSEDSYYLGGGRKTVLTLYSYSGDHQKLSVNSMPLPNRPETIELYADAVQSGNYTLSAFKMTGIPLNYQISLRDKLTGGVIDLKAQTIYQFSIDKRNIKSYGDRFELIITQN